MDNPLIDRPVAYYLDWIKDFVQSIEDGKIERARIVNDLAAPLRGHPLPEWLVKRATWDGVGVLQFKAANPDWLSMYRASMGRYGDEPPTLH